MERTRLQTGLKAVVIGAGLGGLASALRLRKAGWRVTVCDNGPAPGGKMSRFSRLGFSFDTGPTLLTMPHILSRLYSDLGERLEEHLQLEAVDPHAEYIFPDGTRLIVPPQLEAWLETVRRLEPKDAKGVRLLHAAGERIFRLSELTFFRNHPLTPLCPPPLAALWRLPLRDAWGNYARTVQRRIRNPYLQRIYNRYPTYVGSSPYLSPATLLVIPYLEHAFGAWFVKGGLFRIVESLSELARTIGVELRLNTQARKIECHNGQVTGVVFDEDSRVEANIVVYNGDAAALGAMLGDSSPCDGSPRSLSGVVVLVGLRRKLLNLSHHSVLFSDDYEAEFDDLFKRHRFPKDPTVYVNAPLDSAFAPPGGQALYLMANAPGEVGGDWGEAALASVLERILGKLRQAGLSGNLDPDVEVCEVWHPRRFERRFLAPGGAIYGAASHGWRRAFLRPPNRSTRVRGLYCVGGSFHPGGGVPMVLLSAEIAVNLIKKDFPS